MPPHHIGVTTGIAGLWCNDSRTLQVRFECPPALYGPRHALRRECYSIVLSDGSEHRIGAPEEVDGVPTDIRIPVDTAWPPGEVVTLTVTGVEDAVGVLYTDPSVETCPALPEVRPAGTAAAGLLPREDLATDPVTGGLVIRGGTWKRHFGREQLVKVLSRLLTDRAPAGLGYRKGEPVTDSRLAWFRTRAREIAAAQEGVETARVSVTFDRAAGLLKVIVDTKTPEGWESLEMEQ